MMLSNLGIIIQGEYTLYDIPQSSLNEHSCIQSIKRSPFIGARSRSALLIIKRSGAPVSAPPIKKEHALAPAPEKLERAHFPLLHFLCTKLC